MTKLNGRVKTGIKGFDELVDGGIPRGSSVLIVGTPGTCKTIFALETLYNGAKMGEKGLYVSFEQDPDELREQASQFGMDLYAMEKKGLLKLEYIPVKQLNPHTADELLRDVLRHGIKRVVIDSISTLSINAPIYQPLKDLALRDFMEAKSFFSPVIAGDLIVRRFLYNFVDELKHIDGCTSFLISEAGEKSEYLSRDTISEFVCDGIVLLSFESLGGQYSRSLIVRKMRNTRHDDDAHPVEVSKSGLVIHTIK